MPLYLHWTLAPPKGQQVPEQNIPHKFSSITGTQPWASIYRLPKLLQSQWHLITHKWTPHCTTERRNPAPSTRTLTQASLIKKPWQATDTTPSKARELHNRENFTNCQNTERPPQTQQYKQDEETEEHAAGGSDGKASVYNAGDLGSSPGLGRSPGEGNGNPLQYYCLENPMDRGAW